MPSMRAVQVSKPNGPFEVVSREVRDPGRGEVRVKVEACGICHSDAATRSGAYPGLTLPRVPGHEIAGRLDAVGFERQGLEGRRTRGRRLAWRSLLSLHAVPQG